MPRSSFDFDVISGPAEPRRIPKPAPKPAPQTQGSQMEAPHVQAPQVQAPQAQAAEAPASVPDGDRLFAAGPPFG